MRFGSGGTVQMSCMPSSSSDCHEFTSMMIFLAALRNSTELPTDDDGTILPSSVMRTASTMAKSTSPKKPSSTIMPEWDRWMSWNFSSPALILFRMVGSDWYGMR